MYGFTKQHAEEIFRSLGYETTGRVQFKNFRWGDLSEPFNSNQYVYAGYININAEGRENSQVSIALNLNGNESFGIDMNEKDSASVYQLVLKSTQYFVVFDEVRSGNAIAEMYFSGWVLRRI
jgi:hypothetical protein